MKYTVLKTLHKQFKEIDTKDKCLIIIICLFQMIFKTILTIISLFLLRIVIDDLAFNDFNLVKNNILILVGILLISGIICAICESFTDNIFIKVRMNKLKEIIKFYQKIDYEYIEDDKFQEEISYAVQTYDSDNIGYEGTFYNIFNLLPYFLSALVLAIILILVNPFILLAVLVSASLGILVNYLVYRFQDKTKDRRNASFHQIDYFEKILADYHYAKDIKIYNMQKYITNKYNNCIITYKSVFKEIANKRFLYSFLEILGLLILDSFSFFLIINSYYNNSITLGELALYLSVIVSLNTVIKEIANVLVDLIKNVKMTADYYSFIDKYNLFSKWGTKEISLDKPLEIEFKNVSFKYPNSNNYVLNNLNLKIHASEKLAIVGENGAGKSTIIKLICGLYKVTSGTLLVNGINILDYDKDKYLKAIACVFQDVNLYSGTILDNIMGTSNDKERAIKALKQMKLEKKINELPLKYEQPLLKVTEEEGVELSGGEAQKLAIARALYKGGNLVILDEPTSALDAMAEADIYNDFSKLVEGKTAIYISHRLSSTKFCDHIALFSKDGLEEYGTHESLMALKGKYYNLYTIQGKYYEEGLNEKDF